MNTTEMTLADLARRIEEKKFIIRHEYGFVSCNDWFDNVYCSTCEYDKDSCSKLRLQLNIIELLLKDYPEVLFLLYLSYIVI